MKAMAEGHRDGIGDVGRFGERGQTQLLLHGQLHLGFSALVRCGQQFLHLWWRRMNKPANRIERRPNRKRREHAPSK